ncbi:MAG: NAD(P)-binding domain-containing protein, partial [Candidatus Aenigmarchaeota archaeon]|nr:NAD(P)-binding domain-containing protein [Candidatus Aenigmarchaeota archaeon]
MKLTAMFDVVIIGAGPAGITCALRAKELSMNPLLLERKVIANTILDYPKGKKLLGVVGFFQKAPKELVKFYAKDLKRAKIDVREGEEVISINKKNGFFEVSTKKEKFESKSVVLATGIQGLPQTLGVPGENKKHVHYSLDDPKDYKGKTVIVVGGGDTAIEAATSLSDAGANVVISYRQDSFFRAKELNVENINKSNAVVKFSTNLTEIKNKKVILRHSTELVEEIRADDVFILVGTVKNTEFYKKIGLNLDEKENIVHDEKTLETTIPGLFVAGDIVTKEKLILPARCQG